MLSVGGGRVKRRLGYRKDRAPDGWRVDAEDWLRFGMLLTELSAHFVSVTFGSINEEIIDAQRRIVQTLNLDRSTLVQLENGERFVLTHTWHLPGMEPFPGFAIKDLPWLSSAVLRGQIVSFARIDDLPPEAVREKEAARRFGPRSNVTFPLKVGGKVIGAMAFGTVNREREWPQSVVDHLRVFVEMIGSAIARTDAERSIQASEAILSSISGRLIEAQEQERRRIARELHDDIGQRLALLGLSIAQLQQRFPNASELYSVLGGLQQHTSELAVDIQSLSHELHSSRLQYLGLATAMKGFCRELGDQQKVEITFTSHNLPILVPPDTCLCFFRVLQEALHNAAKYSGARQLEVQLWGSQDVIHLSIRDFGSGFDVKAARASRGLGLISMEERLKILKGTLLIESQLHVGTTIHASAPVASEP